MELVQYTVRQGNTLFGIAQFFDTTVQDILLYNNIQNPSQIYAGQTLTIPAGTSRDDYYVVRPNETLWSIAQKFNTTPQKLTAMNSLSNPNVIYPGQILSIR